MKQIKNWKLIAFLGVLIIAFVAIKLFYSPRMESNIPKSLTDIDSTIVTSMIIQPASNRSQEVSLDKEGKIWVLRNDGKNLNVESNVVASALSSIVNLKPQRIVSKKKDSWSKYGVVDSLATRVKVMSNNSVEADIIVGKSDFLSSPNGGYGGAQTYVRLADKDEVFVVDSYLEGQFNKPADDWRDKRFTELKPDSIDQISFRYPADSSYVLQHKGTKWMIDNEIADSTLVKNYLSGLSNKRISKFSPLTPAGNPAFVIDFQFKGATVGKLEAWPTGDYWTMRSSLQPDYFVTSEQTNIIKEVWLGKKQFFK